jgi:hypothetical protein
MDSVYFANIPQGHEVLECLKEMTVDPPELSQYAHLLDRPVGPCECVSATCVPKKEEVKTLVEPSSLSSTPPKQEFESQDPIESPPLQTTLAHTVTREGAFGILSFDSSLPGQDKWELSTGDPAVPCPNSNDDERALLLRELARVSAAKCAILTGVLSRIEADVRPPRKQWYEAEQAILAIYEKRPPSTFQSNMSQPGSPGDSTPPLSKLGRVDAALPDSHKDHELCCCVCGDGDATDDNDIIICDGCSFAAHQNCYFVNDVPDGNWYCQLCVALNAGRGSGRSRGVDLEDKLNSVHCVMCLQTGSFSGGGLMKPIFGPQSSWGHMKCATWVPEAAFPKDGDSITLIPNKDRGELRCSICKLKGGSPVQCAFGKCITAFHISCAASVGLLPEDNKNLKNLYCPRHVKIQLKTSPSTSRLLSLRKLDVYQKMVNDKFIAPKIGNCLISPQFDYFVDGVQVWQRKFLKSNSGKTAGLAGIEDMHEPAPSIPDLESTVMTDFNKNIFDLLQVCCECMRPVDFARESVVRCGECCLVAHALCYERSGVPAPNVSDLNSRSLVKLLGAQKTVEKFKPGALHAVTCTRCASGVKLAETFCVLCMQLGGVLLPVFDEGEEAIGWAHPRCLYWLLPSGLVTVGAPPPQQLRAISGTHHFHKCTVCNSRQGCTVKCGRPGCEKRFHVSCGFHGGCGFSIKAAGGCVVGGTRDGDNESEVMETLAQLIGASDKASYSFRRNVTCWHHERARRGSVQLDRSRMIVRELTRWVPDGIRVGLVNAVNNVLMGESGGVEKFVEEKPVRRRQQRQQPRRIEEDEDMEEGGVAPKRRRSKQATAALATVRMVDGQEITCEDEDWEGSCALCGNAWVDSRGQTLESIACDRCDQWFHFHCVGIEEAPAGEFVCPKCR